MNDRYFSAGGGLSGYVFRRCILTSNRYGRPYPEGMDTSLQQEPANESVLTIKNSHCYHLRKHKEVLLKTPARLDPRRWLQECTKEVLHVARDASNDVLLAEQLEQLLVLHLADHERQRRVLVVVAVGRQVVDDILQQHRLARERS